MTDSIPSSSLTAVKLKNGGTTTDLTRVWLKDGSSSPVLVWEKCDEHGFPDEMDFSFEFGGQYGSIVEVSGKGWLSAVSYDADLGKWVATYADADGGLAMTGEFCWRSNFEVCTSSSSTRTRNWWNADDDAEIDYGLPSGYAFVMAAVDYGSSVYMRKGASGANFLTRLMSLEIHPYSGLYGSAFTRIRHENTLEQVATVEGGMTAPWKLYTTASSALNSAFVNGEPCFVKVYKQ